MGYQSAYLYVQYQKGDMEDTNATELQLNNACHGRYRGWRPVQPQVEGVDATGAIVLQFEATAREDFRVGFAHVPEPPAATEDGDQQPPRPLPTQWMYEFAGGSSGNTEVLWRKAVPSGGRDLKEEVLTRVFAGRTCHSQEFLAYWIVVQGATLVFGMGEVVGQETIAKCVDESTGALSVNAIAFSTWDTPVHYRKIQCARVPVGAVNVDAMVPQVRVRGDPWGKEDLLTGEQREQYQAAYDTALKRTQRFGGSFVAPDVKKFMDPKVIRKLQRTGASEPGFSTGFDMTSQDEVSKREQRMKRFNTPQFAVEFSTDTARALAEGMTQEEWQEKQEEKAKLAARALKFGIASKDDASLTNLMAVNNKVQSERCDVRGDTMVEFREDAIHVYSLDERFQQVRTNDVLAYFVGFGPSYVEWINDSACTVVFEDPFTAGRALIALSQEIPAQPVKNTTIDAAGDSKPAASSAEEDVDMDGGDGENDVKPEDTMADESEATSTAADQLDEAFNRSQWRYGLTIGSKTQPSHKKWRLLLRKATSDDFPPEKTHKKYHERSQIQPRGRDRNSRRSDGGMPSRHDGRGSRSSRSNAHPYERSGGRRRNRQRSPDRDGDRSPQRDTGRPSNRFQMNEDGSINLVRQAVASISSSEVAVKSEVKSEAAPQ